MPASPAPLTPSRIALAFLAWVLFGLLQCSAVLAFSTDHSRWTATLTFYMALAVTWTLVTVTVDRLDGARRGTALDTTLRHALGFLAATLLDATARRWALALVEMPPVVAFPITWLYFLDLNALQYMAVLGAIRVMQAQRSLVARSRQGLLLRAQLARTRLQYLEGQLQPHFLFNALGAVSELAHESPARAAAMLQQLATMLHGALERRGEEITLEEELANLEPYLEIQRMRLDDWITIGHETPQETRALLVPRMVLQPLVENAIRHGLAGRSERGRIDIVAARQNGHLRLAVRDNGIGLRERSPAAGHGIGLENIRERLATLYEGDWSLELTNAASGGTSAEITLPAREASARIDDADAQAGTGMEVGQFVDFARRHPWLSVVGGWTLWGALWMQLSYAFLKARGTAIPPFGRMVTDHFSAAVLWMAVTPLMLLMGRVLPIARRALAARIAVHVVAALAIGALHGWLWHLALGTGGPAWPAGFRTTILFTMIAYVVILSTMHYVRLAEWLRERDTEDAALHAELSEAKLRATTLELPELLLAELDSLSRLVLRDPAASDRALADLGERLRRTLITTTP
ncbi:MAG: histidine kinase internal region [Gemmatimonadetes bacterium]|nr:histidine kinase internal region [Gemmatimonadota bacterium]